MPRLTVLLVEDDPLVGSALRRCLKAHCDVLLVTNIADALRLAAEVRPDAMVTDYDLQDPYGRDGFWLLDRVDLPGILLTGHLVEHGRHRVLRKPVAIATLFETVEELVAATQG